MLVHVNSIRNPNTDNGCFPDGGLGRGNPAMTKLISSIAIWIVNLFALPIFGSTVYSKAYSFVSFWLRPYVTLAVESSSSRARLATMAKGCISVQPILAQPLAGS
jgi:hypothetical protein